MENQDKPRFAELLMAVCALYERSLQEQIIEIYWKSLTSFDFIAVKKAFEAHTANPQAGRFMPKPADILSYLQGDHEVRALQAWSCLQQALRSIGGDQTVVFDDAILHQVVEDMGGWISLAERPQQSMDFLINEFKKRYIAYALHPPNSYPRQLTGRLDTGDHTRQINWLPILIGNPQKAEQVYREGRAPGISMAVASLQLPQDKAPYQKQLSSPQKGNPHSTQDK